VSIGHGREEVSIKQGVEAAVGSGDEQGKRAQEEEAMTRPGRRYRWAWEAG